MKMLWNFSFCAHDCWYVSIINNIPASNTLAFLIVNRFNFNFTFSCSKMNWTLKFGFDNQ